MNQLFHSATVRLTTWYVIILATICLMFSVIVYQITINEVTQRLENYGSHTEEFRPALSLQRLLGEARLQELTETRANLIIVLLYTNLIIVVSGGVGAYFLAKRTLRPIEQAHEQQSRFVSDASHELRTPLATMTTELEVALRDTSLDKKEMRSLLASNLEEVERLTTLSNMLLALSTGKTTSLKRESFDLVSVVNTSIRRFSHTHHIITVQAARPSILVVAHPTSIAELITILIDNAVNYSPSGSDISIVLSVAQKVTFSITNKGQGIAADQLPKIFDRFYQVDISRSTHKGYGLGLALARQISDLHQAGLTVQSKPHASTTFSFSLPIKK